MSKHAKAEGLPDSEEITEALGEGSSNTGEGVWGAAFAPIAPEVGRGAGDSGALASLATLGSTTVGLGASGPRVGFGLGASGPRVEAASGPRVEGASGPRVEGASGPRVEAASGSRVEAASGPPVEAASGPRVGAASGSRVGPGLEPSKRLDGLETMGKGRIGLEGAGSVTGAAGGPSDLGSGSGTGVGSGSGTDAGAASDIKSSPAKRAPAPAG